MAEPKDMRFYVSGTDVVPVGPKTYHTYHGRPREALVLKDAMDQSGWPFEALIALYNATYPPQHDEDDAWIEEWAEAMFHRKAVRDRLAFWAKWIGDIPVESFLVAVLDDFDCLDGDCKKDALLRALNVVGARDGDDGRLGDNRCRDHLKQLAISLEKGDDHGH